jgi:general secretion pathway protein K
MNPAQAIRIRPRASRRDRGVALVAVLWIVAALGILVTGLVQAQRDEVRLVTTSRQTVLGAALGSAAVQLVLQEMSAQAEPVTSLRLVDVSYGGVSIPVQVMPLNGLIDINRAQAPLLKALFNVAGGLAPDRAEALANALVASRAPGQGRTTGPRYEATEDLLQLPGVDFELYARLSAIVTTDSAGSGRVNPLAAPPAVLAVLSGGQLANAAAIAAGRDAGQAGVDTTTLPAEFIDTAATKRFRLQARVPLADGRRLLSTRMVDMNRPATRRVPWQIFHADDRIEPLPTD